jgi:hypothetical protein
MVDSYERERNLASQRWQSKTNALTLETARNHRDNWTQRELDRIMDDETFERGGQQILCKELGRTWAAIKDMRWEVKAELEKELEDIDYDGPIIFCPPEEDPETQKRVQAALRESCIKLTSISMQKTEHEVGSEEHMYELMELYSMLGLME